MKEATDRIEQLMETPDAKSGRGEYAVYLAQIYSIIGDPGKVEEYAKEAVREDPGTLTRAALAFASVGNTRGAEQALKRDSEVSDNNVHLIRGVLAASTGDTVTGIEEIKLAYDFNPRDEEAAYQLGMAYLRAGDCRAALQMFQAVKNLKGTVLVDNVPLLWPLSLYRIAECYERLGDIAAAKPYYLEVAKIWNNADSDLRHKYPAVNAQFDR